MAVRFTASGQQFTRALGLGAIGTYTVTCWMYITTDRNDYSTPWSCDNGQSDAEVLQTGADGTTVGFYGDGGPQTIVNLATGTWLFVAIVRNGTSGTAYRRLEGAGSLTSTAITGMTSSTNFATLRVGASPWGEWLNGRVAGLKIWTGVALSQAECLAESNTYDPVRTANLYACYFRTGTANANDYSGNARNLSGGTGSTTEAGPAELDPPAGATGTVSATLPGGMSADVDATATASGTASASLPAGMSTNMAASVQDTGSVAAELPAMQAAVAGEVRSSASLDAQLGAISMTLAGAVADVGVVQATLPSLVASIAGESSVSSLLDGRLPAITFEADGEVTLAGVADLALPAIGSVISGMVSDEGTIEVTLPALSATAEGAALAEGDLTIVLPAISVDLSGESDLPENSLDVHLPMIGLSLAGEVASPGVLDVELPAIMALLGADAITSGELLANLPSITAVLQGSVSENQGFIVVALPQLTASLVGEVEGGGGADGFQPMEDPESSVRANLGTARVHTKAIAHVRPNKAEAKPQ